jgi:hypothetical protein
LIQNKYLLTKFFNLGKFKTVLRVFNKMFPEKMDYLLDLTQFDVNTFENLLNETFHQKGITFRSKSHGSYSLKVHTDGIMYLKTFNGDFSDTPLNAYLLAKILNPKKSYSEICSILNAPIRTERRVMDTVKTSVQTVEKELIFSDNTTLSDVTTLRYYQNKCNIFDFETLNKHGVKTVVSYGKIQASRIQTPFYAYSEVNFLGESLKIKDAKKAIFSNKVVLKSNIKKYCFGLSYLEQINDNDAKDTYVLICEGEDDAICINENSKSIKALTFGGVTNHFHGEVIAYLKKRFKGVFVCFDNDKAGILNAPLHGQKHDLLTFIVNNPYDKSEKFKDICDLWQSIRTRIKDSSKRKLEFECLIESQIFETISTYNIELQRIKSEKERIEKENELQHFLKGINNGILNVNEFVGEKKDTIIKALQVCNKILLHGNTGIGKSYFFKTILNDTTFLKLGIERIIYVVPRRFLGMDIATDFNEVTPTYFIDGSTDKTIFESAIHHKVIVCTIDSLVKLDNYLLNSLTVYDEPQKHESDSCFRDAPQNVLERINNSKYTIAITATPNILLWQTLGFQYIKVNAANRPKSVNVRFVEFARMEKDKNKSEYKEMFLHEISKNDGKTCALYNDKTALEIIKESLIGKKSLIITSETCEDVIKERDKIKDFDALLCTSVVDAGVNFRFNIPKFVSPFDTRPSDNVQLVGRDRTNGLNELIILSKVKTTKTPPKEQADFKKVVLEAQSLADVLNKCPNLNKAIGDKDKYNFLKPSERHYVFFSKLNNQYEVDYFGLANDCHIQPETPETYFKELQNFDSAFKSFTVEYCDLSENTEQNINNDAAKEIKERNELLKDESLELISKDVNGVASKVYQFTKSVNLKKECKKIATDSNIEISKELQPFLEKQLHKYLQINDLHIPKKTEFLKMTDNDYKAFKGVLMTQIELKRDAIMLNPLELQRQKATINLRKALTILKNNRVKSVSRYIEAVEKHTIYGIEIAQKLNTQKQKLQRIFELYDYDFVEKNGEIILIELKKMWDLETIQSVFDCEKTVKRTKPMHPKQDESIIYLSDMLYAEIEKTPF